jgi:hypothetical protein
LDKVILYLTIGSIFLTTLRKPVLGFWLSLAFFFDPGGFFVGYFNSNLFGPINITDAFFLLMILSFVLNSRSHIPVYDKYFITFFKYIIFVEIYFIFVYGYLIPSLDNRNTFLLFLIKERNFIYGCFIFWFVYVFVQRGLIFHYKITIYSGVIILSLFFLDQILGLNLIPVSTILRYKEDEMIRIGMLSYGLFQFVFPLALIVLFIKRTSAIRIPLKKPLYISGILMTIVFFLTLTRRTYLEIAVTVFMSFWIINKLMIIRQGLIKITIAIFFVITVFFAAFPSYIRFSFNIYQDTFLLIARGEDSRGYTDYRLSGSGDLEYAKEYIKEKPWFGQGFNWMTWDEKIERDLKGDKFAKAWDAAQEVAVYYALFSKGLIGIMFYTPVYILIISCWLKIFKVVKKHITQLIFFDPILLIFGISTLLYFILEFTVKAHRLYAQIGYPGFMLQAGLLFGLYTLLSQKYEKQDSSDLSPSYRRR